MSYQCTGIDNDDAKKHIGMLWLQYYKYKRQNVHDHKYLIYHTCAYFTLIAIAQIVDNASKRYNQQKGKRNDSVCLEVIILKQGLKLGDSDKSG